MKGDSRVIDYLNKGLRHELTAVNQYWLHYRLLDNWGYKALAKQWRKESIEEMQHADKLTTRIIFLDGFPNMQVIDPLHIGQTVKEVLDSDLGAELSARELYQEASTYCHSVRKTTSISWRRSSISWPSSASSSMRSITSASPTRMSDRGRKP